MKGSSIDSVPNQSIQDQLVASLFFRSTSSRYSRASRFQVKCQPTHTISMDGSCASEMSRSAGNCNEKNQLSGCPYISNQQRDCSFNCVDLGSGETSWQISLYDITNKDRMYAHHFHATYVTCGGWMCVVHIHRYIDHYASLHPLASAVSSNAASIVSSNAVFRMSRMPCWTRILSAHHHLELKKPNAWGP